VNWKKDCDLTEGNEKEYIEKQGTRENTIERIIILGSENSNDSDSSDDTPELSENSGLSGGIVGRIISIVLGLYVF
jgi:hypothetical protein